MPMLNGIISKINTSAGNLTFKQTVSQTIVSLSHAPSALHPVIHKGSGCRQCFRSRGRDCQDLQSCRLRTNTS